MNWPLLRNSLVVSGLATFLALIGGFLAALFATGLRNRWRKLTLALALCALALPPFVVTNSWLHFLGDAGAWRVWLPFNILSLGGTVWILALLTWPVTFLLLSGAWSRIEPSQLEADPALTGWTLIRHLLLPLGRTALLQAAVLTFVLALNNFGVPAILQVKVFPAEVWVRFNTTFDSLGALRTSWPLIVAPLVMVAWLARGEIPWSRLEGNVSPRLFRQQTGRGWFLFAGAGAVVLCLLSVGLPIWQLATAGRTWSELPGALAAGQRALWNTLLFAIGSASVITVLGLGLMPHSPNALKRIRVSGILSLLWFPFLVPGVLIGIALIAVFNHAWSSFFYQSAGIVVLAFVIRYLAWGCTAINHAFQSVDANLTDAARLEGATRWQLFRLVHWPQIAPQVAAAWYIVFLLCLWDVETMILVMPPGGETLAVRVFNLLHYGHNGQVNALCLTLLAVALAPLLLWRLGQVFPQLLTLRRNAGPVSLLGGILLLIPLTGCTPPSISNDSQLGSQLFSQVQIVGSRGVGVGQFNKPRSVAVDAKDNLYAVDMTGRVQKFSPAGAFLLEWQMPQTDLGKPKGMCRDRDGNIVVLEPHYQRVNYFSPEGKLLAQWGAKGTNAGQLNLPRAVAVNSRNEILVTEYGATERLQRFTARGGILLGGLGRMGSAPGEFNRPEGLCVDTQDRIYVADSCNHRVQVFSPEGKFLRAYGRAGSGRGELSYPYDICVDPAGRQYVCEFGNSRIQVFDANDQPIEIIGGPGGKPGQFSNPWGVALDSHGNLYVADSQNHRVQKLIRNQGFVNLNCPPVPQVINHKS